MSRQFLLRSIGSVAVCVLTLSACGGQDAPPAASSGGAQGQAVMAGPPVEEIPCGTVPATDGQQAKVSIQQGSVDCAEAVTLLTQYFAHVTPAAAASPDGAGPIALDAWTCGSDPGSALTATCSTEDGRQVDSQPTP